MLTLFKEFQGIFIPLAASDLANLCQEHDLKNAYLDGISYMHDMVVPFSDDPVHSVFNVEDAIINCGRIKEKFFRSKDSLSQHFKYNFETASYFANQGYSIIGSDVFENITIMRRDASAYIKALLYTYNIVRTTY